MNSFQYSTLNSTLIEWTKSVSGKERLLQATSATSVTGIQSEALDMAFGLLGNCMGMAAIEGEGAGFVSATTSASLYGNPLVQQLWSSYFNTRHLAGGNTNALDWNLTNQLNMSADWELRFKLTLALFLFHQIVFLGRYIPYWICDKIPSMQQYKIQKDKTISNEQWWACVRQMVAEQVFLQLPLMFGFLDSVRSIGMDLHGCLPSWASIAYACLFFLLVEDTCAYWLHRALHWGPLYKHIHKFHHSYTAPFGLAAEYGHPAETILLGVGFTSGPIIWRSCWGPGSLHVFTMFMWMAVRLITTVDTHCGYDFPWSIHHWFPLWSGADHHDLHHQKFVGNYSGTFRHWDWIMGTYFERKNVGSVSATTTVSDKKHM